ncbi:MAG: HD domain-containing protein [Acidimicrobiales bacterium]|nr:HD domain-containing protein [Acidimicrobiales bacterium]
MAAARSADLVGRARAYARAAHLGDTRKGSGVSYFDGHLEPVAQIVQDAGGTPVQVAAAYLHDVVEDHGGLARLDDVRAEFGDDVATVVADLSDSVADTDAGETKAPWRERKQAYVEALPTKSSVSLVVAAADKLHNVRSIVDDLDDLGDDLWARFTTEDAADHVWYYRSLADGIRSRMPDHDLSRALCEAVDELAERAGVHQI